MTILKRSNNRYYLKRRVPKRYAAVESRAVIWQSLNTDSPTEAQRRGIAAWQAQIAVWEALLRGDNPDADTRFIAAQDAARGMGYRFLPIDRVATLPMPELLERMEAALTPAGKVDPRRAAAVLGTAPRAQMTLSRALEQYWVLARDLEFGKSADQIRRARNPRKKAFNNLIGQVGDMPLSDVTRDDLLDFREWWWDRITAEGLTPDSANKDFTYIASTLRLVNTQKRLGLNIPFDGLAFAEGVKTPRLPFSENWIRKHLLAPNVLDGLNTEARCLLLGMINTGYRPSEAQDLRGCDIRLDTNLPHISIEPVNRTLKTADSKRIIPLAGISLEAFRACPDGFPRYRGKAGLSATVNKYLRANGLAETAKHTLYGLRHSFEDRLLDRDVDERIRRDLMGHALGRKRYGRGASPEKLAAAVQSIAL
jgi:integrase